MHGAALIDPYRDLDLDLRLLGVLDLLRDRDLDLDLRLLGVLDLLRDLRLNQHNTSTKCKSIITLVKLSKRT